MTDWDEMVEYIHKAMQAVDEAQSASQKLKQATNHETFEAFREKLEELHERLSKLKTVLDNEEAFAIDELIDALSQVYTDHRADYRRTPRMRA